MMGFRVLAIYSYFMSNVTVQDRPTRIEDNDCSVRRLSHNDKLWAVAWNRLFDAFFIFVMGKARCSPARSLLFIPKFFASPDHLFFIIERQGSVATRGCTVYLRSEERPSHSDNLWVVDWNPLFESISS